MFFHAYKKCLKTVVDGKNNCFPEFSTDEVQGRFWRGLRGYFWQFPTVGEKIFCAVSVGGGIFITTETTMYVTQLVQHWCILISNCRECGAISWFLSPFAYVMTTNLFHLIRVFLHNTNFFFQHLRLWRKKIFAVLTLSYGNTCLLRFEPR